MEFVPGSTDEKTNQDHTAQNREHINSTTHTNREKDFQYLSCNRETGHCIGIDSLGVAWSWSSRKKGNEYGQLGRDGKVKTPKPITEILTNTPNSWSKNQRNECTKTRTELPRFVRAFTGGDKDSGHSALLDQDGQVYLFGADRWQQLGLGSGAGGSAGYTWSSLWQTRPILNHWINHWMPNNDLKMDRNVGVRDVALGAEHTLILSSNQRDVIAFGKGSEGQLGLGSEKPFVSGPRRSKALSVPTNDDRDFAAVCAVQHCSFTLDSKGHIGSQSGKCQAAILQQAIKTCQEQAQHTGLLESKDIHNSAKGTP